MTAGPPDAIAPGAASQLVALLTTVAVAAAMAGLVSGSLWLRRRRRGRPSADPCAGKLGAPAVRAIQMRRLLGAMLILAVALVTAPAIRQLWPHPDLGPRLLVIWLLVLLLPAGAWLLTRAGDDSGRPRS